MYEYIVVVVIFQTIAFIANVHDAAMRHDEKNAIAAGLHGVLFMWGVALLIGAK